MRCNNLLACPICGEFPRIQSIDDIGAYVIACCPNGDFETNDILRDNLSLDDKDSAEISDEIYIRLCEMWQDIICKYMEINYIPCTYDE